MRFLTSLLLLLSFLAAAGAAMDTQNAQPLAAAPTKQVYVMRHLHTPAGAQDPDLTAEGKAHAQKLVEILQKAAIKAIFVTDTKRARQTAANLAERLNIDPTVYDPKDAAGLIAAAGETPGNVLIVGHSNTVPDIVERLGGVRPAPLTHEDFGMVWRVDASSTKLTELPVRISSPGN
jgi:broad specificity phosphatase PhoE